MAGSERTGPYRSDSMIPLLEEYLRDRARLACPRSGQPGAPEAQRDSPGLLTVITVAFNAAATLSRTIDSIAAQTYPNLEYIVVDGGSTDGTVELLRQRAVDIELWLSEPDRGISDAFNKGIALARGEFIAIVNSDDWIEPEHMARAVEHLRRSGADFAFGDLVVHDSEGDAAYGIAGDPAYGRRILHAMPDINHPSVVCRREVYERYGLYDRDLRIAMDYEWLLRIHLRGARGEYVPGLTSHMFGGGVSQLHGRRALAEVRDVSIRYGYPRLGAWTRFIGRDVRARAREFIERRVSRKLAQRLRALIHRGYRPSGHRLSARGS